jgi:hypothetical protein
MNDFGKLVTMFSHTRQNRRLAGMARNDPPGRHVQILADGTVQAISAPGAELIDLCRLNRPLLVDARRRLLNLIALLRAVESPDAIAALRDLLAVPSDLPDLAALRPPGGNVRPNGIADSFLEQRRRGELGDLS